MELRDGYKSIYYKHTIGDKEKIDTILFFITGSGHSSLQYYLSSYFQGLVGNVKIFALQKRYVSNRSTGIFKTKKDYDETNTINKRVNDNIDFINHILRHEHIQGGINIVILGVSSGGRVAPEVAYNIPQCTHLAVLGDGGMKGIESFRIWGKKNGINFDKKYHEMKNDPNKTDKKILGQYTYKWWLSVLDSDPMNYLIKIDVPIFYSAGEKDDMMPNLKVVLYPDCNHVLVDSKGNSFLKKYMRDLSLCWQNDDTVLQSR